MGISHCHRNDWRVDFDADEAVKAEMTSTVC